MRILEHLFVLAVGVAAVMNAQAQAPLPIYTDRLVNAFQDWGWGTRTWNNASPVYSGTYSVSVSGTAWNVALGLHHDNLDTTTYGSLGFWAHGGPSGGQILRAYAHVDGIDQPGTILAALQANTWKQYIVPLASLYADNKTNVDQFTLQLTSNGSTNTFYVDNVQLAAKPAPALVHVSVNATQAVRGVDSRWFGVNTAIWDSDFDTLQTVSLLKEMDMRVLRFPGGSLSDEYHWGSNKSLNNTWQWVTSFANFVHVATNVGAQAYITVNYGSGTAAEAAGWVRHSNVTNQYGFKYWEIGNENYGGWETDSNTYPHDPYTYAVRATNYMQQMKAADPTIKIGLVVTSGEGSYSNLYSLNHPAINPRTSQTNYGWTPILLTTLKNLGVTPDFLVHHVYPEYTGQESDPLLLQSTTGWAVDAADLRQQVTDYFGVGGTNIELVCTENNSNSGQQGKQSTSLVNGVYYADSLGQLMKTEFNSFVWWDLRNGTDTSGSFDPSLYGWRTYGDLGLINGPTNRHPPFYAAKLIQYFARSGDTILGASSDYLLLSAYAARRASGAVTLLVLNKDTITNLNAQIAINGFVPNSATTIRSYGIPQDEAARTNGAFLAQDIVLTNFASAGTNFNYNFPPLSLTLLTLAPSAARLIVLSPVPQPGGQFVFQLQGQPGVRYFIQNSTNLSIWTTVATNTLAGSTLNVTNTVPSSSTAKFWRAVWQP